MAGCCEDGVEIYKRHSASPSPCKGQAIKSVRILNKCAPLGGHWAVSGDSSGLSTGGEYHGPEQAEARHSTDILPVQELPWSRTKGGAFVKPDCVVPTAPNKINSP